MPFGTGDGYRVVAKPTRGNRPHVQIIARRAFWIRRTGGQFSCAGFAAAG